MDVSAPTAIAASLPEPMPQPAVEGDADGFGFDDFLDIINPLQHVPILGTIYRAITGDEISTPARLAGDTLYGGLLGFLGSVGTLAFEQIAGESTDHMLTSLFDNAPSSADPYRANRAYAQAQALITP